MTPIRKPRWLKVKAPTSPEYLRVSKVLSTLKIHTVCQEANCPNRGDCWFEGHAAFLILGPICTRSCRFCDVTTGKPQPVDPEEPTRLAEAVATLKIEHVVITSVDRDDLADGGAGQFAATLSALNKNEKKVTTEVLTPDFKDKPGALEIVLAQNPTIFNHNLETVPRLFPTIRPTGSYQISLDLLKRAKEHNPQVITKSGIMLGLGEEPNEVLEVMDDLRGAGVVSLTIGQYLAPSSAHHPVARYWEPEEFAQLKRAGYQKNFQQVECHPLARSSYRAQALLKK